MILKNCPEECSIFPVESESDKLQSLTIGGKIAYSYLIFILWILLTLIMLIVVVIQSVYGIKILIAKKT